ncbi:MAG: group II intron maturase-specific domain-containing protein [Methylococcales bacterium]
MRSDQGLEDLARMFNPILPGWSNYSSRYYQSARYPILKCLERRLVMGR